MASSPKSMPSLLLDQLPDVILQRILDITMTRDSPFYIDDSFPGIDRSIPLHSSYGPCPTLTSPSGARDPDFTGWCGDRTAIGIPDHHRTLQPVHRRDWVFINSTTRRIREFSKRAFFRCKVFALHAETPRRLGLFEEEKGMLRMARGDQQLAMAYIRDIVIVNAKQSSPETFLALPKTLSPFPRLVRCTLLFAFESGSRGNNPRETSGRSGAAAGADVEWITAAWVLAEQVKGELRAVWMIWVWRTGWVGGVYGPRRHWERHEYL